MRHLYNEHPVKSVVSLGIINYGKELKEELFEVDPNTSQSCNFSETVL